MKIILLSHFFPFPPRVGAEKRIYLIIKALSEIAEVILIAQKSNGNCIDIRMSKDYCKEVYVVESRGKSFLKRVSNRLRTIFSKYPPSGMGINIDGFRDVLYSLPENYNNALILLESIWFFEALKKNEERMIVLDQHNLDSEVLKIRYKNGSFPLNVIFFLDYLKQRSFEKKHIKKAKKIFVVSEEDERAHKEIFGFKDEIYVLPNSLDMDKYEAIKPNLKEDVLLMLGDFGYSPNREGYIYFIKNIFKRLRKKRKDLMFLVAGKDSEKLRMCEGVTLYGKFENLKDILKKSTISVVPILTGGGSRYKILESLASSIPVVSTVIGAQGLRIDESEGLLTARNDDEFIHKIEFLLDNKEEIKRRGIKGRQKVTSLFGFENFKKILLENMKFFKVQERR